MITIHYSETNSALEQWVGVLEELVLSHQLVKDNTLKTPLLRIGKTEVSGEQTITDYVHQLRRDTMRSWATC